MLLFIEKKNYIQYGDQMNWIQQTNKVIKIK
jgi:hypothetical protein